MKILFLVILCCRLKIFAPIAILAWTILVPVNWTNNELELAKHLKNVTSSDIDKLTISNIPELSNRFVTPILSVCFFGCFKMLVLVINLELHCIDFSRFWAHIIMAYAFTIWTCYMLMKEYETVANMRLQFIASESRRPDQFTVRSVSFPLV